MDSFGKSRGIAVAWYREMTLRSLVLLMVALSACDSGSNNDGGLDVTTEPPIDLCSMFTSVGDTCPYVSKLHCDPACDGGCWCYCAATDTGPRWACTQCPSDCSGCQSTSPLCDGGSDGGSDASDAATIDAGVDATDATTDVDGE